MKKVLLFTLLLIYITSNASAWQDSTQYSNSRQLQKAQNSENCGREYNDCQSNCVHIELVKSATQTNVGIVRCNPKNNRISQCRNSCYNEYTSCLRR